MSRIIKLSTTHLNNAGVNAKHAVSDPGTLVSTTFKKTEEWQTVIVMLVAQAQSQVPIVMIQPGTCAWQGRTFNIYTIQQALGVGEQIIIFMMQSQGLTPHLRSLENDKTAHKRSYLLLTTLQCSWMHGGERLDML